MGSVLVGGVLLASVLLASVLLGNGVQVAMMMRRMRRRRACYKEHEVHSCRHSHTLVRTDRGLVAENLKYCGLCVCSAKEGGGMIHARHYRKMCQCTNPPISPYMYLRSPSGDVYTVLHTSVCAPNSLMSCLTRKSCRPPGSRDARGVLVMSYRMVF